MFHSLSICVIYYQIMIYYCCLLIFVEFSKCGPIPMRYMSTTMVSEQQKSFIEKVKERLKSWPKGVTNDMKLSNNTIVPYFSNISGIDVVEIVAAIVIMVIIVVVLYKFKIFCFCRCTS